eukprot:9428948-Lingulodinium_polyedra.AAC.1
MSIAQPNTATARSKWRAAGGWYSTPPGALGGGGSLALDSTEAAYASRDGCEVSVSPKWRRTACIDGRRMCFWKNHVGRPPPAAATLTRTCPRPKTCNAKHARNATIAVFWGHTLMVILRIAFFAPSSP